MMTKLAFILLLLMPAQSALAAEAWNCQFPGHGGVWQVDGTDLVAPASSGSSRFPIVRNTADAIVALTEEFSGRRFEMAIVDRRDLPHFRRPHDLLEGSVDRPLEPRGLKRRYV